jgi:hypothetical protein
MTLILTALCKNGICVCADKRYRIGGKNQTPIFEDNHKKIYTFKNVPILIFNHGVNKFNGRYWDSFCLDYDRSNSWINKDLIQMVDEFQTLIESDVQSELEKCQTATNTSGFVCCGKTKNDNRYKIKELYWNLNSQKINFIQIRHRNNIIGSGTGYQNYLEDFMKNDNKINNDKFWSSISLEVAEKELRKLFYMAVDKRKSTGGDEFSDDCDTVCI